jgi:hypothetical protein
MLLLSGTSALQSQSLPPGAIAFIALQTDNPTAFAFVNLVPLNPFTSISFTDNKWGYNHLVLSEQTVVWTSPDTALPVGTIVKLRDNGTPDMGVEGPGSTTGRIYITNGAADQILAYTGAQDDPSFIAGISSTNWQPTCDSLPFFQFRTCLPAPLVNGYTAIAFTPNQSYAVDNGYFAISPFDPNGLDMLSIINNINYWYLDNSNPAMYDAWPDWNSGSTQSFASTIQFAQPSFSITEGGSQATITLNLSAPQFTPQTVILNILEFPGITSGDYLCTPAQNGTTLTLQIPANTQSITYSVQALLDGIGEIDENITFSIGSTSGGLVAGAQNSTQVTIISTEQNFSQVRFTADTLWVQEGANAITVPLELLPAQPGSFVVIVTALNGPGISNDYFNTPAAFNNQLLLQSTPNNSALSFGVTAYDDFLIENDEFITFSITTVANGIQIGSPSTMVVGIRDNDNQPVVYIPQVYLNEICALNQNYPDENNQLDDWIELYNADTFTVDLSGYRITNNLDNPGLFFIPPVPSQVSMPAGSYKILWADQNTVQGPLHLNFSLSENSPGTLGLFFSDGETLMDEMQYTQGQAGTSFGRFPNGPGQEQLLWFPTPGASNTDSIPTAIAPVLWKESAHFSLFPNPSNGRIQLVRKGEAQPAQIDLLDLAGRALSIEINEMQAGKHWMIQCNAAPGLYMLRLCSETRCESIPLIIR